MLANKSFILLLLCLGLFTFPPVLARLHEPTTTLGDEAEHRSLFAFGREEDPPGKTGEPPRGQEPPGDCNDLGDGACGGAPAYCVAYAPAANEYECECTAEEGCPGEAACLSGYYTPFPFSVNNGRVWWLCLLNE